MDDGRRLVATRLEARAISARVASRPRRFVTCVAIAIVVAALLVLAENVAIDAYFPHLSRVTHDFSPAYLRRYLDAFARLPPQTIVLGDSIAWGYRLHDDENAVAILKANGCACSNLAFNLENPTNEYALVRYLQHEGVRPRAIVLQLDQVAFNPATMEYRGLRDQVYEVTEHVLTPEDLALFRAPRGGLRARVDRVLSAVSRLYAFRSDAREALLGEPPERLSHVPFQRFYSLAPLDEHNVGVTYLERMLDLLHATGTPVIAFLAPTNHAAFGPISYDPRYRANAAYVERLLARRGARVLRLDDRFEAADFLDDVHLSATGQRKLASILAPELQPGTRGR
jgi:hypothetical protein